MAVAEPPRKNSPRGTRVGSSQAAGVSTSLKPRATAQSMAERQRDISVSEFFAKNRHLLGFDNPRKALLTCVKEAVDNSLDACEEGGILPDVTVVIEDLQPDRPSTAKSSRYRVTVVDNGPGIVRQQVENIFGRLLYGSKFHRLKMSRGQQGIGISAAGMYGLITTGRPMMIQTRPNAHKPAHHIELAMNTKTNRAEVTVDEETDDFPLVRLHTLTAGTRELWQSGEFLSPATYPTGTSVSIELEGRYQKGRGSVDEFLELTAIANPHARITFVPPSRTAAEDVDDELNFRKGGSVERADSKAPTAGEAEANEAIAAGGKGTSAERASTVQTHGAVLYPRAIDELPPETKEIQPHPKGIELGILLQMLKEADADKPKGGGSYTLYTFLQEKFSRISSATASALCDKIGVTSRTRVGDIDHARAEKLFREFQDGKFPPPPTDCLAPIGVRQLLAGLLKGVRAEFYAASSRSPEVYRGRPFQIEAAIAFGGDLPADDSARVIRFANRVPLQFQQSACSSIKAVTETAWKNYSLQQPRNSLPAGPLVIMIHMASVWVPFTSESKEAIADYDEIRKEMKLALMECGRKLGTYLRKRLKMKREGLRRDVFERYIGEIAQAVASITNEEPAKLYEVLLAQARQRTAVVDQSLDEDGKVIKPSGDEAFFEDDDGVIIVDSALDQPAAAQSRERAGSELPASLRDASKAELARVKVASLGRAGSNDVDDADQSQPRLIQTQDVTRTPRHGAGKSQAKQRKPSEGSSKTKSVSGTTIAPTKPQRAGPAPKNKPPLPSLSPPTKTRQGTDPGTRVKPTNPAASSAKTSMSAGKPAKPKLRLVNGKLVPASDGPGLF